MPEFGGDDSSTVGGSQVVAIMAGGLQQRDCISELMPNYPVINRVPDLFKGSCRRHHCIFISSVCHGTPLLTAYSPFKVFYFSLSGSFFTSPCFDAISRLTVVHGRHFCCSHVLVVPVSPILRDNSAVICWSLI